ncbi:MAG: DUF3887 domain-containing protein [Myxococcales bacterium]|nr:DUF3887 domain-containing protein [Myxococcales bacterium]
MRRVVALLSLCALSAGCSKGRGQLHRGPPPMVPVVAPDPHTPEARARRLVEQLRDRKFAAVREAFDPTMTATITEAALGAAWDGIVQRAGRIERIESVVVDPEKDGFRVARVKNEHSLHGLEVRVVFDRASRVSGLWFEPRPPPWAPPAYVSPTAITDRPVDVAGLPGTLTLPKSRAGKARAVLLVHGSGPNDRDETLGGRKPFRDLAEGLATKGLVVLRWDKRSKAAPETLKGAFDQDAEVTADARGGRPPEPHTRGRSEADLPGRSQPGRAHGPADREKGAADRGPRAARGRHASVRGAARRPAPLPPGARRARRRPARGAPRGHPQGVRDRARQEGRPGGARHDRRQQGAASVLAGSARLRSDGAGEGAHPPDAGDAGGARLPGHQGRLRRLDQGADPTGRRLPLPPAARSPLRDRRIALDPDDYKWSGHVAGRSWRTSPPSCWVPSRRERRAGGRAGGPRRGPRRAAPEAHLAQVRVDAPDDPRRRGLAAAPLPQGAAPPARARRDRGGGRVLRGLRAGRDPRRAVRREGREPRPRDRPPARQGRAGRPPEERPEDGSAAARRGVRARRQDARRGDRLPAPERGRALLRRARRGRSRAHSARRARRAVRYALGAGRRARSHARPAGRGREPRRSGDRSVRGADAEEPFDGEVLHAQDEQGGGGPRAGVLVALGARAGRARRAGRLRARPRGAQGGREGAAAGHLRGCALGARRAARGRQRPRRRDGGHPHDPLVRDATTWIPAPAAAGGAVAAGRARAHPLPRGGRVRVPPRGGAAARAGGRSVRLRAVAHGGRVERAASAAGRPRSPLGRAARVARRSSRRRAGSAVRDLRRRARRVRPGLRQGCVPRTRRRVPRVHLARPRGLRVRAPQQGQGSEEPGAREGRPRGVPGRALAER